MPYTVRRFDARALGGILLVALFVAGWWLFAARIAHASRSFLALGAFAVLYLVFRVVPGYGVRLRVDRKGVRLGSTAVPWPSIQELVLLRHGVQGYGDGPPPEIGLRLRPDAPLPGSMTSLIRDPDDPFAIPPRLRVTADDWTVDEGRLAAAVRALGNGVLLVEDWDGARRVIG